MNERELFTEYRQRGGIEFRNKIVEHYLYIASMIAKKFVGRGVEYDDLYQVASLALIKGVDRFDPDVGVKFSTFITPTITGEIKNYFRDRSRLIHLPRHIAELRGKVKESAEAFLTEEGRSPTARELAERLKVTEEEVVTAMEAGGIVSLDKPVEEGDEEGSTYYDMISAEDDSFELLEQGDLIRSALNILTDKEREIVAYRFKEGLSQMETAKKLNVSQMYISRIEHKILEKLRENLKKSLAE